MNIFISFMIPLPIMTQEMLGNLFLVVVVATIVFSFVYCVDILILILDQITTTDFTFGSIFGGELWQELSERQDSAFSAFGASVTPYVGVTITGLVILLLSCCCCWKCIVGRKRDYV